MEVFPVLFVGMYVCFEEMDPNYFVLDLAARLARLDCGLCGNRTHPSIDQVMSR